MPIFLPFLALISLSGHAWSENIGWVSFRGPGYVVTIDDETGAYGGYAWSERVGWMKLMGDRGKFCTATEGGDCADSVVNANSGGWNGTVKFKGANYGVTIAGDDTSGCHLTGYGWGSDVVGWLKFKGAKYGVKLDRCIVPIEPPKTYDISCSFNAGPKVLIAPQKSARLTWECQDADACRILPTVGIVPPVSGGETVYPPRTTVYMLKCTNLGGQHFDIEKTVTVVKSAICEINPADPGCE